MFEDEREQEMASSHALLILPTISHVRAARECAQWRDHCTKIPIEERRVKDILQLGDDDQSMNSPSWAPPNHLQETRIMSTDTVVVTLILWLLCTSCKQHSWEKEFVVRSLHFTRSLVYPTDESVQNEETINRIAKSSENEIVDRMCFTDTTRALWTEKRQ